MDISNVEIIPILTPKEIIQSRKGVKVLFKDVMDIHIGTLKSSKKRAVYEDENSWKYRLWNIDEIIKDFENELNRYKAHNFAEHIEKSILIWQGEKMLKRLKATRDVDKTLKFDYYTLFLEEGK